MSRCTSLAIILLLALGLLAAGCSGGGASATARGDDDDDNLPPTDDDNGDDDGQDDDNDDDDTAGEGRVHILAPEDGQVILGYQVSLKIKFDARPDYFQMWLDGADLTYTLNYFPDELTAWTDLQNVPEGDHEIKVSGWFNGAQEDDVVDFSTTLAGGARIELVLTSYLLAPGGSTTADWIVYDDNNQNITDQVNVDLSVDPDAGVSIAGQTITFENAGSYVVTASGDYNGETLSDSAEVVVYEAGDVDHVEIDCTPSEVEAGENVTCDATIYDDQNNEIQGTMFYTVDPPEGSTVSGNVITLTKAGASTITGTVAGTDVSDSQDIDVSAGPAFDVTLTLDPDTMKVGETTTANASVVDQYGNDVAGGIDLEVSPSEGIVIDGNEITANKAGLFVVTAWDAAHTMQDQATLTVTENSKPHIEIYSPERGAFVSTAAIILSGRAWDDYSSIESVKVDGTGVYFDPETGNFTYTVTLMPGMNVIFIEATDEFGNSNTANTSVLYAGSYLPNGQKVDYAVGARITPTGLDSIEGVAEDLIEEYRDDLWSQIPNPLFEESVNLLIAEVTATATAQSIDYTPVDVELISQPGGLHLHASTNSLEFVGLLTVVIDWIIGGTTTTNTDFTVSATSVTIDGDLVISANAGALDVQLVNVAIAINGLSVDVGGGFTGDILTWIISLFTGLVQDTIESLLTDMINTIVPPLLQVMLNQLDLSFNFSLLDFDYHFTADFKEVDFDSNGGELWLRASAWYGNGSWAVGPNTPDLLGSLSTNNPRPDLGNTIPGTSTPYGFGVILGDDIINQILHVAHRSGVLSLNLDQETLQKLGIENFQLTTTWLAVFMPGIIGEYGLNKNVEIRLRPLLPPVMIMNPQKSLDTEIQMGDFVLEWWCEKTPGNWELFMKVALGLFVPTAISVDAGAQTITVEFGDIEMYADLFEAPVFEISDTFVEVLLPALVQALVPALLNGLLESIPIPSFEGFTLQVNGFLPVGPALDWAGLFGDLIQTATEWNYLEAR